MPGRVSTAQPHETTPASVRSRMRNASVHVTAHALDILGSRLALTIAPPAVDNTRILYRFGDNGPWRRLPDSTQVVDVTALANGIHTLQLRRVETGAIFQDHPDALKFEIARDPVVVARELTRLVRSDDPSDQDCAVRFLACHPDVTAALQALASDDPQERFLLRAAVSRANQSQKPRIPATTKLSWLSRRERGFEILDFSEHPEMNPWFERCAAGSSTQDNEVTSLAFDGRRLWFAFGTGVGALDPDNMSYRLYGINDGIPGTPTGGVRVGLNAQLCVATQSGLVSFDEQTDRFHALAEWNDNSNRRVNMDIDAQGRPWVSYQATGLCVVDNDRVRHEPHAGVSGLTRDATGRIWLNGSASRNQIKWQQLYPSDFMATGIDYGSFRITEEIRPFVDYLNRLYLLEPFKSRGRYHWPLPNTDHPMGDAREGSTDVVDSPTPPTLLEPAQGRIVADSQYREIWHVKDKRLICDTAMADPAIDDKTPFNVPVPPPTTGPWNEICRIDDRHLFLAAAEGLYIFDGKSWSRVDIRRDPEERPAMSWPKWPQPYFSAENLYQYDGAERIVIIDPFRNGRSTKGHAYEIRKKDRDFVLVEKEADGSLHEYAFQKPYWYGPSVLFLDYAGDVWAAGTCYLYRFDGASIETIVAKDHMWLGHDHIYSFCPLPDGSVWIGTERGLAVYRHGGFVEPSLKTNATCMAIAYDSERDRLVISESWRGIRILEEGTWRAIGVPFQGCNMVRSINIDEEGIIWLATNGGLVSLDESAKRWIQYDRQFTEGVVLKGREIFVNTKLPYSLKRK